MSGHSKIHNTPPKHTSVTSFTDIQLPPHAKGVLLDLDNTLYNYESCHTPAILAVQKEIESIYGPVVDFKERYSAAKTIVKQRTHRQAASHSRLLYFQQLLETFSPEHNPAPLSLALESLYWDTFFLHMRPVPGAVDFLSACRTKGIKVILVSDMTAQIQFKKIEILQIVDLIDGIVTSEEAGIEKPSPDITLIALKKIHLQPSEVIFIGDDPHRDGAAAEHFQIPWIHMLV